MAVDAGTDQTICDGGQATLTALASSGNNYTIGVTAINSSYYILSGAFSGEDPPINITLGDTLTFGINATGHPFYLKTTNSSGSSDAVNVANNGAELGAIIWTNHSRNLLLRMRIPFINVWYNYSYQQYSYLRLEYR